MSEPAFVNEIQPLHEIWKQFDPEEAPDHFELEAAIGRCVIDMLSCARNAVKPKFSFGFWDKSDEYYHFYFAVEDLAVPLDQDRINFHGQNISRVVYNGAILVDRQTKGISIHT